jgi:glycosyltransferase involved in cell wall biosynthesis
VKVVYSNHTSVVSGAERSLLTMIRALEGYVEPLLACPAGDLAERARSAAIPVVEVPAINASFKVHPRHTTRGFADLFRHRRAVGTAAESFGADIIHANSIRSGLAVGARSRRPLVVHLRDVLPQSHAGALVRRRLNYAADALVANSKHTAASFGRPGLDVIANPVDREYFDAISQRRETMREALDLPTDATVFAVVGQITPWKGQDTAIKALAEVRSRGVQATLLIIGAPLFTAASGRDDNHAFERQLHALSDAAGVHEHVMFLGQREDVPALLRAADALLMPSWEEPFGRSAAEAMAVGTPVIATSRGGTSEFIVEGEDGLLEDPHDLSGWAAGMQRLAEDVGLRERLASAARAKAQRLFGLPQYRRALIEVYERCLRD